MVEEAAVVAEVAVVAEAMAEVVVGVVAGVADVVEAEAAAGYSASGCATRHSALDAKAKPALYRAGFATSGNLHFRQSTDNERAT